MAAAGAVLAFLAMATDVDLGWNVSVAIVGCVVAAVAVLDGLGTFDGDPARDAEAVAIPWLRLVELGAALICVFASLRLAVTGALPLPILCSAVLVTGSFLWAVVAIYRVAVALHPHGDAERPLFARHGFWLVAGTTLIYLPRLGSFSLIDPWETHYGEVAREMLVRGDWITFWWAQEGLFFSKPPLDFWIQGIAFGLLGVKTAPDHMLDGVAQGLTPAPEWAARFPVFLSALLAGYLFYRGVAAVWGRRVGLWSSVILATMPYWYFLTRQTMTDMPYAAPLTAALGLCLIGFSTDPDVLVRTYPIRFGSRVLHCSSYHLVVGALLLIALPQILYLASRNLTWQVATEPHFLFRPHLDAFLMGSGGGNCGIPGNERCSTHTPIIRGSAAQPAASALFWAALAGLLVLLKRHERRVQRLAFLGAWIAVALSALAKGAPGLVIPIFVVACFIVATGRWRDLGRLELGALVLAIAVVTLPWYVQAYYRHGWTFLDRLIFHDMYKRAFVHVHDTNEGVDTSLRYYLWQLGYGTFPWSGLAAVGLVAWFRGREDQRRIGTHGATLLFLWFVTAFALFSLSLTKFHHYILPAVPPLAVLAGLLLDRALEHQSRLSPRRMFAYSGTALGAACALVLGSSLMSTSDLMGQVVDRRAGTPSWLGAGVTLAAGFGLVAAMFHLAPRRDARGAAEPVSPPRITPTEQLDPAPADVAISEGPDSVPTLSRTATREPEPQLLEAAPTRVEEADPLLFGGLALLAGPIVALVGRDLTTTVANEVEGQARLMHLFVYQYERPWPPTLDFTAALFAFAIVATVTTAALVLPRARAHGAALSLALGIVWAAWGTNVYLVAAASHWGQRETIAAYYRHRNGPEEPIIAYQLNWKGENFYTGNRIAVFASDNEGFAAHVKSLRERGQKVAFFTTEQKRIASLQRDLGKVREFQLLIPPETNNKFAVVRVEF
ncbi:MAG: glycosyltransferase family 39 protein [Polyangiaceae bacterium]|nr:glycosyltransferase family 39 protein [Polyangiaceae bacterium]